MSIDFKLLEYSLKGKSFCAELLSQTKYEQFPVETRLALRVILEYFKSYKQIPSFDVACEEANKYNEANAKPIKEVLQKAYETNLTSLPDGDFPFFIDKFKKEYNLSFIKQQHAELQRELTNSNVSLDKINERVKKTALEINALKSTHIYDCGELKDSAKLRLVEYNERRDNPELAKGIYSGFKQLDMITNGFRASELILVSGSTGSGKSILMMNMAINAWLANNLPKLENQILKTNLDFDSSGHNVWFITIENTKTLFERRLDSCIAQVACDHIRDGTLTEEEYERFGKSLVLQKKYGEHKHFHISDLGRGVSMAKIEAEYEKLLNTFEPDLIVVDYLGIMKAVNETGQDWLDQGSCAADMYEFCRTIKKPMITASQMKGSMRTQQGLKQFAGEPESVARSKMITDNVSLNLQIEKSKDFHISAYFNLHVAKNRDGKTGDVIPLIKEYYKQRVCDPDDGFLPFPSSP